MSLRKISFSFSTAIVFFAALSFDAVAQEASKSSFMQMNTRLFDLGVDPESLRRDPHFIPLNRADWLDDIIDNDPVLHGTVVHIRVKSQPITKLWAQSGPGSVFNYSAITPEEFTFDGYEARSTSPTSYVQLFYLPSEDSPSFSALCAIDRETGSAFRYCGVFANYPPDPNIFILARVYNPGRYEDLPSSFRAIADRIRKIAYCLDVTDSVLQEVPPFKSLEALQGCSPDITS
ncbi:hypothetical protein [Falsihalocynthiibacter arcticus]|uniref:Uncharacterized protein n=1 Tax=Falsihalocynthiibacter arcticus TaxID=1579316 RepID=A0A126V675_9RHOB|nr:hypothetical protein [Falsihalocynthiibacter arcticus]AML53793.1 hypothetical protein RC74_21300 [Falsihalocynthiibacter arcticus]